jgi:Sulfotransferase family
MEMPGWLDVLGRLVDRTPGLMRRLGDLESSIHRDALEGIVIDRPIYIAGVARAGSTILLETLASHPKTATHRYRDFPPIMVPILWNRAFGLIYGRNSRPVERAHKDRILVTPDSPEALEEVLWMAFFDHAHDARVSNVLDRESLNAAFESFYGDHVRKILFIRGGLRYLAKCNYSLTRLGYLARLFPDARFVVPVRDPIWHVASLVKQHHLFCNEERRDPRILAHMRRVGHFEFGLDRRAANVGDGTAASIAGLWDKGDDVRGTARLWASLYGFIFKQLQHDAGLHERTMVLKYENLCDQPVETLRRLYRHVELSIDDEAIAAQAAQFSRPTYYQPPFRIGDERVIREETDPVATALGYPT